eukprot:8481839-Karenia_brevis.AAC.1
MLLLCASGFCRPHEIPNASGVGNEWMLQRESARSHNIGMATDKTWPGHGSQLRPHTKSKGKKLEVITYNGNYWSTIKDFLGTRRSPTCVVAAQEHRLRGEKLAAATQSMAAKGWNIA